eukprot:scaffold72106_cov30-Phaeocystis_antarctica.AAC.1
MAARARDDATGCRPFRCRPGAHASAACIPRAAALRFALGAAVVVAAAATVPGHRGRLVCPGPCNPNPAAGAMQLR